MNLRASVLGAVALVIGAGALAAPAAARPAGTLVLAYDFEIWRVPMPEARIHRISPAELFHDAQPALSPAGGRLAFARSDIDDSAPQVMVRTLPDGDATAVARGSAPTFSPDGGELAYRTPRGLAATDLATGTARVVTHDARDRDPAWSSRDVLAFSRGGDVMAMSPSGSGLRRAVWSTRASVGVIRPAWSRDGRKLVVTLTGAKCAVAQRSLRTAPGVRVGLALCGGYGAWSPDGSKIAVQSDFALRILSASGRTLDSFCDVGRSPRGLVWAAGGPVLQAGRRGERIPRHCTHVPESGGPPGGGPTPES